MTKSTKWYVRPTKTKIRPVWSSLSRVFAVRMKKAWVLSYPLSAQWRLWSDWVDAQADQSLPWAHMPFCRFCHALAHLDQQRKKKCLQICAHGKIQINKLVKYMTWAYNCSRDPVFLRRLVFRKANRKSVSQVKNGGRSTRSIKVQLQRAYRHSVSLALTHINEESKYSSHTYRTHIMSTFLNIYFCYFSQKISLHFMWTVCQAADDSQEISRRFYCDTCDSYEMSRETIHMKCQD